MENNMEPDKGFSKKVSDIGKSPEWYVSKEEFLLKFLLKQPSLDVALEKCMEIVEAQDIIFGVVFYTELLYKLGKKNGDSVLINKAQDNFVSLRLHFPLLVGKRCKNIEDLRYFENF